MDFVNVSDAGSELVNVAVPRKFLGDVYQLLGELVVKGSSGSAPKVPWPTEGEEPTQNRIDWTDASNCRRLRGHLRNRAALAMLNLTAEKADLDDPKVYLEEVMVATECTHAQAGAGLGALTRGIRKLFGIKGNWPAPFQWDRDQNLAFYVMKPEVAIAWKASAE